MQFWRTILERDWGRFEMMKMQLLGIIQYKNIRQGSNQESPSVYSESEKILPIDCSMFRSNRKTAQS